VAWCGEVGAETAGARGFYDEAMRCRETWKEDRSCSVTLPCGRGNSSNAGRMPIDHGPWDTTTQHHRLWGARTLFLRAYRKP
jgi:hypothetical protein